MARIRSIKPEFRTSLTATSWPREVRLFFVLLWGYVDDEGRGVDEPRLIRADCFPLDDDVTPAVIDEWLDLMAKDGSVVRYVADGRRYLAIPSWREHQKPQHPNKSRIPPPPSPDAPGVPPEPSPGPGSTYSEHPESSHEDLMSPHEALTPEGEGEQGAGRGNAGAARIAVVPPPPPSAHDPEPPLKCSDHTHTRKPPACGSCGDARREHEAWKRRQATPTPTTAECPIHPGQPTGSKACPRCTAEAAPSPGLRSLRGA